MPKIRLIGDIHGDFPAYLNVIDDVDLSLQIGDFGIGFATNPATVPNNEGHKFIRGNHDSPQECKAHPQWIPDGSVYKGMFCVGGAMSIDKAWRTEDVDWWRDEELSSQELQDIIDHYNDVKPDIVVTHEAPENVARYLFPFYHRDFPSRTRDAFEVMMGLHQPKLWVFGHWHQDKQIVIDNTRFICLGIMSYIDVEIPE